MRHVKRIARGMWDGEARGWNLIAHSEWTPAVFIAISWIFLIR